MELLSYGFRELENATAVVLESASFGLAEKQYTSRSPALDFTKSLRADANCCPRCELDANFLLPISVSSSFDPEGVLHDSTRQSCTDGIHDVSPVTHDEHHSVPFVHDKTRDQHERDKNRQKTKEDQDRIENMVVFEAVVGLKTEPETYVEHPGEAKADHYVERIRAEGIRYCLVPEPVFSCYL